MNAFLLVAVSLVPATMVIFGLVWRNNPPKTINAFYGYRTTWSMKSKETWDFAHKHAAGLWLRIGAPLWLLSVAAWYIGLGLDFSTLAWLTVIVTSAQCIFFVLPVWPTEMALRQQFDAHGKKKTG